MPTSTGSTAAPTSCALLPVADRAAAFGRSLGAALLLAVTLPGCAEHSTAPVLAPVPTGRVEEFDWREPLDAHDFPLEARAGQFLTARADCPGSVRITLRAPSGAERGEPGQVEAQLAESGRYRLRLAQGPMGESWTGHCRLDIRLQ